MATNKKHVDCVEKEGCKKSGLITYEGKANYRKGRKKPFSEQKRKVIK